MKKLALLLAFVNALAGAQTFPVNNLTVSGTSSFTGTMSGTGVTALFSAPPTIGGTTANAGSFTNLSASGTLSAVTLNQTYSTLTNGTASLSATTTAQTLDSFPIATFRGCKYIVTVTQGTNYQMAELLSLNDGANTFLQTYAMTSSTGSQFATYSTTIMGGNLVLSVTFASGATAGSAKFSATRIVL